MANASLPQTTACQPQRITFPGALTSQSGEYFSIFNIIILRNMSKLSNPQLLNRLYQQFLLVQEKNKGELQNLLKPERKDTKIDMMFLSAKMQTLQSSTEFALRAIEQISLLMEVCSSLDRANRSLISELKKNHQSKEQRVGEQKQSQSSSKIGIDVRSLQMQVLELKKANQKLRIYVEKYLPDPKNSKEDSGSRRELNEQKEVLCSEKDVLQKNDPFKSSHSDLRTNDFSSETSMMTEYFDAQGKDSFISEFETKSMLEKKELSSIIEHSFSHSHVLQNFFQNFHFTLAQKIVRKRVRASLK